MSCILRTRCALAAAGIAVLALALTASASMAQSPSPPPARLAGAIERVDKDVLTIKSSEGGGMFEVELSKNAAVFAVSKGTMADLKPGAFIGVGAMPQADGSQRAIQVTVFAESQRGLGEGFRPWDRLPNSTMTNATVAETVASVDGPMLTVKYKDGEKKIVVPADATILAYAAGDRGELKVGARVAILRVKQKPDGGLEADRINVGRGDVVPRQRLTQNVFRWRVCRNGPAVSTSLRAIRRRRYAFCGCRARGTRSPQPRPARTRRSLS